MLITQSKRHLIRRGKQIPGVLKATSQLLFAICLCSCFPERFRHEKYDCSGSPQTINTIIINKAKPGNYAKILGSSGEKEANITQINDHAAWLTYKNVQIKINRKSAKITMVQGTKYITAGCKKTVFTM